MAQRTEQEKPVKVLMVTGEFPPIQGGVGDYTARLGRALGELGVAVEVATGPLPAGRLGEASWEAFPVHRTVPTWGWRSWPVLARLARERAADILHIQYQAAAYRLHPAINLLPWWLRLSRPDLPCVVTFHDLRVPYLFPKAERVRWWAILALAAGCRAAISTNAEDFNRLASYAPRVRPYRVPIGANVEPLPTQVWRPRDGTKPPREGLVVSHFGFLNESKGCQDLVEALAWVRAVEPERTFTLRIVGGTVGESDPTNLAFRERLEQQIARHGLTSRVAWTGFLPPEEVSDVLPDCDLCALPYRDGASFRRGTLIDALVHGLPTVTTEPTVPVPELRHGENVWLVPREDPKALAQAILHLADRPDLCQRLSRGALDLGRAFRWDGIAQATQEVYRDVLGA